MDADRSTMTDRRFDLIVVGLGAMGAATAYQAQRLGLGVLGIDRFEPPHSLGSTNAETRITRLAVGEGAQYLPFVRRSHEIWRELEGRFGEELLHRCGGLIVTEETPVAGQRWQDFVLQTSKVAEEAAIDFTILGHGTMQPPAQLRGLEGKRLGFEPTAGLVMAERAVALQIEAARRDGATIRTGETVSAVIPEGDGISVVTDGDRFRGEQVVLAAGPWTADLVDRDIAAHLRVTRQVVFWFEVDDLEPFRTDRFPFVMWVGERDEDYVAIFPVPPGGTQALKVMGEQFLTATDPATVDRSVTAAEAADFYHRHLSPKLVGASPSCVKAQVCLYTNTPDDHFLIDRSPDSECITIMSPCSGHGFKHSAALGEAVAQRIASGESDLDLSPFRRDRLLAGAEPG